jgi:DNA (cytosine-5)-methyltransferase 1
MPSKTMFDTRLARHNPHIVERFKKIISLCHAEGRLNTSLSAEHRLSLGLRKCAIRVMDPERPAPTITSLPDDLLHYGEARTLTVRETARLQTFPDWFAFQGKYTTGGDRRRKEVPRFTQVANAVPPLLAEAIGSALYPIFQPLAQHSKPIQVPRIFRHDQEGSPSTPSFQQS